MPSYLWAVTPTVFREPVSLMGFTITVRPLGIPLTEACLISELRRVCSTCKQCPTLQPTGRRGGCAAARIHASAYPSYRAVRHGPLPRVLCTSVSPNLHVILLCLQGNFNPLCHVELQVSILESRGHRLLSDRTRRGNYNRVGRSCVVMYFLLIFVSF